MPNIFCLLRGKGRFVVETGDMNVRVLGTAFNVNAYKNEAATRTTLVHGKVEQIKCSTFADSYM